MQRITRDRITPVFDRRLPPAARVAQGEVFIVETEDSRGGLTRVPEHTTAEYLLAIRKKGYHGNPVTGPIFVDGARPGDTLAVEIVSQECDSIGYTGYWPHLFGLQDFFTQPATTLYRIEGGFIHFNDEIRIPVKPMIGTIGTTPPLEAIASGGMGRHGGNLDTEEVRAGSTVFLPVFVEGALLCLGDCHARQSDGEIASLEMRSIVTLKCTVIAGRSPVMNWPRVETPDSIVTVALACPLEDALRLALRDMILWLEESYGLSKNDGYMLFGLAGDARPGQAQVSLYSMRCIMPKAYLPTKKDS